MRGNLGHTASHDQDGETQQHQRYRLHHATQHHNVLSEAMPIAVLLGRECSRVTILSCSPLAPSATLVPPTTKPAKFPRALASNMTPKAFSRYCLNSSPASSTSKASLTFMCYGSLIVLKDSNWSASLLATTIPMVSSPPAPRAARIPSRLPSSNCSPATATNFTFAASTCSTARRSSTSNPISRMFRKKSCAAAGSTKPRLVSRIRTNAGCPVLSPAVGERVGRRESDPRSLCIRLRLQSCRQNVFLSGNGA